MKHLIIIAALAIAGCASPDYAQYAKSAEASSVARSKALSDIAASGDSSAKVAAVMALALGAGNNTLAAPAPNAALQWASILVPSLTQVAGMRYQYLGQQTASNNAAAVAISTNATMQGIAGKIQAPVANVTTNTDRHDTVTTLSGTGTMGSGAYSTTDNHAVTTPAPVVVTPVTPTVPVVVVPDTVINQPVVVPDVIAVTPTVLAPVVVPDVVQIVPVAVP